jgi:hypothetical protein
VVAFAYSFGAITSVGSLHIVFDFVRVRLRGINGFVDIVDYEVDG